MIGECRRGCPAQTVSKNLVHWCNIVLTMNNISEVIIINVNLLTFKWKTGLAHSKSGLLGCGDLVLGYCETETGYSQKTPIVVRDKAMTIVLFFLCAQFSSHHLTAGNLASFQTPQLAITVGYYSRRLFYKTLTMLTHRTHTQLQHRCPGIAMDCQSSLMLSLVR